MNYNRWPATGKNSHTCAGTHQLGRIAVIAVGLHYSWFIIALLITFSLADHFHSVTPKWNPHVVWTSAIVARPIPRLITVFGHASHP